MKRAEKYAEVQQEDLNDLVKKHTTLVRRVAHHLKGRLPEAIQVDDLIQAGMIGLIEAAKKYDANKGASFETFAGIRIRGAMLDEVRKNDWVPRSVHRNAREIAEAIQSLEGQFHRDVKDSEVAEFMGLTLSDYHHMLQDTSGSKLLGFDDLGVPLDIAAPVERHHVGPVDKLLREDFKQRIADQILTLPEREKLVLSLYYDEELNLKEIGQVIGVSESRISQIHSQAMLRLRARLQMNGE
ncbi:RNA polymerase sigma factor FliA [Piscirickettsia litoralis]|uniref:RNA polymerase sigma factor FliA n=1 Tax=Piscirickettsia litoralis TaxID=1891921 RepID=A0ABX2ZZR4_9GAMM|nr:RNA polymerase sigma factor FliA [Piscirickettsia litoralis]ODN42086.1 RNA polymerase sigma factor FliA [Piscirickettsia litoralis]